MNKKFYARSPIAFLGELRNTVFTTSVSGQPHPSVNAVFLRPKFHYGRDDRPKYKTFGEYASRLTAVVESRLPNTGEVFTTELLGGNHA